MIETKGATSCRWEELGGGVGGFFGFGLGWICPCTRAFETTRACCQGGTTVGTTVGTPSNLRGVSGCDGGFTTVASLTALDGSVLMLKPD